jgi:GIY-YIG catalytic domain/NUMOD3 motif
MLGRFMGTIYILRNKINDKCYVGQTINFKERFRQHQHSNSIVGRAICKYGSGNFEKLLLENVPEKEMNYWEIHYIEECNSVFPNGYNLTYGGEGGKKTKEWKELMSKLMTGKHPSEETRIKIREGHKGQIAWNKGIPLDKEHSRILHESNKGNTYRLGISHTEETKRKISVANKGKTSPRKGVIMTEEQKLKISKALLGNVVKDETKKKISEGLKKAYKEGRR